VRQHRIFLVLVVILPLLVWSERTATDTVSSATEARASQVSLPQAMKAVAFIEAVARSGRQQYGSGTIINAYGTMLTNAHVVQDATKIFVTLYVENKSKYQSQRKYDARVLKWNSYYDLALIDIHANTSDYLRFAADTVRAGDEVKAIGNPAGLQVTTSKGIVSAIRTNRDMNVEYQKVSDDYINEREFEEITWVQTDAAVNPGNSGGPLLNQNNEIIGINTSGYRGWEGLNFALHVKHLKKFSAGHAGKS